MDKNKIAIESLSMDLLRVALGYNKGSTKMAERFLLEALERIEEIDRTQIRPYFVKWLDKMPRALSDKEIGSVAENALMFSVISKNYSKKYL